jgi:hypothetical protein
MKTLIALIILFCITSCSPTSYHYSSKCDAWVSKTDTITDYYKPNKVY